MAIHTNLKIHAPVGDLVDLVTDLVTRMPRDFKPIAGKLIVEKSLKLSTLVMRANKAGIGAVKVPHLDELLEEVNELELLFRASAQRRAISRGQYGAAITLTQSIGKQANGWRTYSSNAPVA